MIAMEWAEIDWKKALWRLPPDKMKTRQAHDVPLSTQAISILKDLEPLTGNLPYVFPNARRRKHHASPATINSALQKLGYDTKQIQSAHGFRASARTLLDEQLGYRLEWIEQQLAHQVRDSLGRAYNRTKHLPQRQEMMQRWADYLTQIREPAHLVAKK
jgi:integrase